MASPIAVWWLASRGNVHPFLHERLSRTLNTNSANFAPVVRQAWRLALEAAVPTRDRLGDGWVGCRGTGQERGLDFPDLARVRVRHAATLDRANGRGRTPRSHLMEIPRFPYRGSGNST